MQAEVLQRTRLAFNVGITGHRDITNGEKEVIQRNICDILQRITTKVNKIYGENRHIYDKNNSPLLRVVTLLAEGSDRIAARAALETGLDFKIQCILPMNREDYMYDFKMEASKEEFLELVSRADSVMELDFGRQSIPACYFDAGSIMLEQSDILIALWDGNEPRGVGGTGDMVRRAEQHGIPVLWLNRSDLGKICYIYLSTRHHKDWENRLEEYIAEVLVPRAEDAATIEEILRSFHGEDISSGRPVKLYARAVRLLSWTKDDNNKKEKNIKSCIDSKKSFEEIAAARTESYLRNYERADKMAVYYADIYRSASFMRALLPFLATLYLSLGFYWNWGDPLTLVNVSGFFLQAVCLFFIIYLSNKNERLKWHKKFVDYRILAELFRQIIFAAPMGYASRGIRDMTSDASWYKWYYRNIIRSIGVPSIVLTRESIDMNLSYVKDLFINDQIDYHEDKIGIFNRISRRMNKIGYLFFALGIGITVVRCIVYFLVQSSIIPKEFSGIKVTPFFNMLSLLLPAIGASVFSILTQCGFETLEQKHRTMKSRLEELDNEANFIGRTFNETSFFILRVMNVALEEVSDWRLFVKTKSIKKT